MEYFLGLLILAPAILVSLTIHEFSHAWVAYKLGDYTAKAEGRVSLNPLVHLDPIGTLALFIFRIGWAKPVPVIEYNFKNPVLGTMLTALAGPASNLIMAGLGTIAFYFLNTNIEILNLLIVYFVFINIVLMCFNLLPIPPLDGHKIIRGLLPSNLRYYWEQLEKYSLYIFIPTVILIIYTNSLFIIVRYIVGNLIPTYHLYL